MKRFLTPQGVVGFSLIFAISEGPSFGWDHPLVIALFAAAAVLFVAFVTIERLVARPMLDLSLFTYARFVGIQALPVAVAYSFVVPLFLLPIRFVRVEGMSELQAGLMLLPLSAPNARGKALVNMLPIEAGERITTIMPLPEDEASWETLDVMFATASGGVRRNKLSDFVNVNRAGKIAMKLDEGDHIVDVQICTENDDVLLTTADGQCIRFAVPEVRVFKGRDSTGVRGINLARGDEVISLAILRHLDATPDERAAYLKRAAAARRALTGEVEEGSEAAAVIEADIEESAGDIELGQEKYAAMGAAEQFILTISERGYGKRTSSFEYRVTGRGGKGIVAMVVNDRNGKLVASFPAIDSDQLMLVTDGGQLIRVPVDAGPDNRIRIAGRSTQGVTVFNTAKDEKVVSVECINDDGEGDDEAGDEPAGSEPSEG